MNNIEVHAVLYIKQTIAGQEDRLNVKKKKKLLITLLVVYN